MAKTRKTVDERTREFLSESRFRNFFPNRTVNIFDSNEAATERTDLTFGVAKYFLGGHINVLRKGNTAKVMTNLEKIITDDTRVSSHVAIHFDKFANKGIFVDDEWNAFRRDASYFLATLGLDEPSELNG